MSRTVPSCPSPVYRVVPYLHVADVEQAVGFYAALGFDEDGWYRKSNGQAIWASVKYLGPAVPPPKCSLRGPMHRSYPNSRQ